MLSAEVHGGIERFWILLYNPNSTIFVSQRIIRRESVELCEMSVSNMFLARTDFPVPVAPAIKICGVDSRLTHIGEPDPPTPMTKDNPEATLNASANESIRSPQNNSDVLL